MRALALVALLAAFGCYAPKLKDGDFTCGVSMLCPQGFLCIDGVCRTSASGPSPDLSMMTTGDLGMMATAFVGSGALGVVDLTGETGTLQVNTETGTMRLVGATTKQIVTAGATGFTNVAQPSGGPPVAMWGFDQLVIPSTVMVSPDPASASIPVFLAKTSMTIQGTIDWRGYGGFGGLANMGGQSRQSGIASGGGAGTSPGGGGGGAGYARAGTDGTGPGLGSGGAQYGATTITPVHFGSGGGGGGGSGGGKGGAGGGAIVLLGNSITLGGKIDVSGNDGQAATGAALSGGGGGGSGGSIVISGNSVTLRAGHQLVAVGGAGKAGVDGPAGDGGVVAGGMGGAGADGRIRVSGGAVTGVLNAQPTTTTDSNAITAFPR